MLRRQVPATGPTTLDTSALPNGLYYLTGADATGKAVRQAIEVRH